MKFFEINVCQVMIFRAYTVYNKHDMIKFGNQTRKNRKYSNNLVADCLAHISIKQCYSLPRS